MTNTRFTNYEKMKDIKKLTQGVTRRTKKEAEELRCKASSIQDTFVKMFSEQKIADEDRHKENTAQIMDHTVTRIEILKNFLTTKNCCGRKPKRRSKYISQTKVKRPRNVSKAETQTY